MYIQQNMLRAGMEKLHTHVSHESLEREINYIPGHGRELQIIFTDGFYHALL